MNDRVTLVVSSLANGGAERVASVLANGIFLRGRAVQVVTYHPELADDYPLHEGIVRTSVDFETWGLGKILRLRDALRLFQPDIVIAFTNKLNVRTLCAGVGQPWRTIVTEHNVPQDHILPWKWEVARRWSYPWAAALVGVSPGVVEAFPFVHHARRCVIPNPVAPHSWRRAPGTHRRIVAAGRLVKVKGFDLLIEAFSRADLEGWSLDIWGDGPERAHLEAQVSSAGLGRRIAFRGWTSEPMREFPQYDFLVLSSRSEGFGNVLVEAFSVGLPVVSFDCPTGPRTVVRSGSNGLLVPAGDVAGLAKALETMAQDASLRDSMGAQAIRDADQWSQARILDAWEEVFDALSR